MYIDDYKLKDLITSIGVGNLVNLLGQYSVIHYIDDYTLIQEIKNRGIAQQLINDIPKEILSAKCKELFYKEILEV